jgi:hypothetical protein
MATENGDSGLAQDPSMMDTTESEFAGSKGKGKGIATVDDVNEDLDDDDDDDDEDEDAPEVSCPHEALLPNLSDQSLTFGVG